MKLNLTKLKEDNTYVSLETSVSPENIEFLGRQVKMPLDFSLELDIIGEEKALFFTGTIEGEFLLKCSRCLKEFKEHVKARLEFSIPRKEIDDFGKVDISEYIKENLILAIPIKALCRKDCEGICSICGQDLNEGDCDCVQEDIDPRLEKLQQYYDSNE